MLKTKAFISEVNLFGQNKCFQLNAAQQIGKQFDAGYFEPPRPSGNSNVEGEKDSPS